MTPKAKKRIPNAERSAETKRKLLDAAERCLIKLGYSHTTNMEVCRRARVSNGSLLYHFRTRENLLASTLERLYGRFRQQVILDLEGLRPGFARVDHLVDVLWSIFDSDEFKVVLELWLAAANDRALRRRVFPVMEEFADSIEPTTARLLPDLAEDVSRFSDAMRLMLCALEGMGLERSTFGPDVDRQRVRQLMKEMLRWAFEKGK